VLQPWIDSGLDRCFDLLSLVDACGGNRETG
jgi:hypothetical protein